MAISKRCPKCGLTKPYEQWGLNRAQKDGFSTWCLSCKADDTKARVAYNRGLIRAAKQRPCVDCGNTYPYYVMDLDHLGTERKVDKVSAMVGHATARVVAELAKCEAVCSNCHRIREAKRGGWA